MHQIYKTLSLNLRKQRFPFLKKPIRYTQKVRQHACQLVVSQYHRNGRKKTERRSGVVSRPTAVSCVCMGSWVPPHKQRATTVGGPNLVPAPWQSILQKNNIISEGAWRSMLVAIMYKILGIRILLTYICGGTTLWWCLGNHAVLEIKPRTSSCKAYIPAFEL